MNTLLPKRLLLGSFTLATAFVADASTDYGPATWKQACSGHWYTSHYTRYIYVIHDMEGYYASTLSYLQGCNNSVSVHYTVNGKQDTGTDYVAGDITQMVRDAYSAWTSGCWNRYAMQTEHEGFASNPAWYTPQMYQASGILTQTKANQNGIPKDRNHIIAHGQKLVPGWTTYAAANFPFSATCNSHTDPGPYWDWNGYMNIVTGGASAVNNAAVVSASVPGSVEVGKPFSATVTMNNNGSSTWVNTGTHPYSLGSQSPQDNTTWGTGRVSVGGTVSPGQNKAFTATFTAPAGAGSYPFAWKMVQDGVQWFGAQYNGTINVITVNNAAAVGISKPATVNAGATFSATITMNNNGSKPWTVAGSYRLGSQNPQDNGRWGLGRIDVPGTINPGQNGAFTTTFTAPTTPGTYAFDWKMVQDGVEWFGAIAASTITVVNPAPNAPSGLAATAISASQINLTWVDNSSDESGFRVEHSTDNVNFTQFISVGPNVTATSDTGLTPNTLYYYRVRSYNASANSAYSATVSKATLVQPPVLNAISSQTGTEGQLLTFTASSSNPNQSITTTTFQDFEGFSNYTTDDQWMFRKPANSSTTSAFIDPAVTNYTKVQTSFPAGHSSAKVLRSSWSFKTGTSNPWMRLVTSGTVNMPNPTIDLEQVIRFDICSDKTVRVGLGTRETGTVAAIGADGGTSGTIEWVGVTNSTSGTPNPSIELVANTWTTVTLNIPFSAVTGFTGNGIVNNGKGTLEELAILPTGGMGVYNIYLDNFAVVTENTLTYSLDAGAPAGASIHPRTGVFSWTPTGGQAGTYNINVRVTDRLGYTDVQTISFTVIATGNHPPVLAAIGNKTVNELATLTFTATATDQDAGQTKTFSLDAGNPAGSSINSASGAFTWTPTEAQGPGSYPITVRVTDNGSPSSNDFETITVTVNEANVAPVLAAISNQTIDEGQTLNVTASATDADLPANTITYSLDAGAPAGMTINTSSGAITWATSETTGPIVNSVTVTATDSGGLSDSKTFSVTVNEVNIAPVLTVNTTVSTTESVTDFESFTDGTYNGTVLFRQPSFSSTTLAFLDTAVTNITTVTAAFPAGDLSSRAMLAAFNFKTGTTNPWVRLSTGATASLPNPTVRLNQHIKMDIYTDKSLKVGLGIRETGTSAVIGQNGGTTGPIEWVGVSSLTSGMPNPTRTVSAGTWQTLDFYLPTEAVTAFTGDGVLSSATGKGVLECLALVPNGGMGTYTVYIDNISVVTSTTNLVVDAGSTLTLPNISATDADFPSQTLTFSLDAGAPAGATINPVTGVFTWTPTGSQGPSTNVITIRVTDNGPGTLSASQNITVVVNKVNTAPTITSSFDQVIELNGGSTINLTFTASDDDIPTNSLTFSLQGTPPVGSSINASSGVFTWTPPNQLSTNIITVRVTDNGVPALYDEKDLTVIVSPTNTAPTLALGSARVDEKMVNFESFANGTASGSVMFKTPVYSGSTALFIDTAATNYTTVTGTFPAGNANAGARVLKAGWSFKTGTTNPWVRLTTASMAILPNPTLDLAARVKFDIYCDKSLKVGLGIRETATSAAIGADGGLTGGVEWIGAIKTGTSPVPSRTLTAGTWTTVEFVLPAEYCTNFSGGNSVLASGKGTLEHLALVPNGGMGAYTVYVDNFEAIWTPALPSTVTLNANSTITFTASATDPDPGSGFDFGLDADAAPGSSIDAATGAFTWTPTTAGTTNAVTVFVNDNPINGAIAKTASQTFNVIVNSDPFGVQSGANGVVAAGESVTLSWSAIAGASYQIQSKQGSDGQWTNVGGAITANSSEASTQVPQSDQETSYRVISLSNNGSDQ
ncbi:MAG: hypothetical protein JWM68_591 [Verrucomicrobiales bacterium]|nr:hypothetical protein [Verrucomicrobiales bacterium]